MHRSQWTTVERLCTFNVPVSLYWQCMPNYASFMNTLTENLHRDEKIIEMDSNAKKEFRTVQRNVMNSNTLTHLDTEAFMSLVAYASNSTVWRVLKNWKKLPVNPWYSSREDHMTLNRRISKLRSRSVLVHLPMLDLLWCDYIICQTLHGVIISFDDKSYCDISDCFQGLMRNTFRMRREHYMQYIKQDGMLNDHICMAEPRHTDIVARN